MKKWNILITVIIIALCVFGVFRSVNYDTYEFGLGMKSILRQKLTLEEMRSTSIYKAYGRIEQDTKAEEIDGLLNKKSKTVMGSFSTWKYPYGYLSIWTRGEGKPGIFLKVVKFTNPYTTKLSEKELYTVFECNSLKELQSILGETALLATTYDKEGLVDNFGYEWRIETSLSEEFIKDIEEKYGNYVSLEVNNSSPINFLKLKSKQSRLHVLIKPDSTIESFSLDEYK